MEVGHGVHDRLSPNSFYHSRHIDPHHAQVVELHRCDLPDCHWYCGIDPLRMALSNQAYGSKQIYVTSSRLATWKFLFQSVDDLKGIKEVKILF